MDGKRQTYQHALAWEPRGPGEAPARGDEGTEPPMASQRPKTRLSQNN
jgi:hypothetical protein